MCAFEQAVTLRQTTSDDNPPREMSAFDELVDPFSSTSFGGCSAAFSEAQPDTAADDQAADGTWPSLSSVLDGSAAAAAEATMTVDSHDVAFVLSDPSDAPDIPEDTTTGTEVAAQRDGNEMMDDEGKNNVEAATPAPGSDWQHIDDDDDDV